MSDSRRTLLGLGVLALIALALTVLPRGGNALDVAFAALQCVFLAGLAASVWRLYNANQFWLNALSDLHRGVLYGAGAIAVLASAGRGRFEQVGGSGTLLFFTVLGLCAGAAYWVWRESNRYAY
ncbi:MAG: hypothetical protein JHC87_02805 [Thermoleophilaceae bacterium]|nr:hypothetical protein [Thermoleophilaceae bacterium]